MSSMGKWLSASVVIGGVLLAGAVHAEGDTLTLRAGDTLTGTLLHEGDDELVFDHPELGRLTLERQEVERYRVADAYAFELRQAEYVGEQAEQPDEEDYFLGDWETRLSLGFSGSEGNSRDQSLNARLRVQRSDEKRRVRLVSEYYYGRSFGQRSSNEVRVEGLYDWKLPDSNWFAFLEGGYNYDEFRDWKHRVQAHAGVGYTIFDNETIELDTRAGLGGFYNFEGADDGFTPEAMFGASIFRWNITDRQELTGQTRLYPNLEDLGDIRWNSSLEWSMALDRGNGMRLGLGVDHRYESDPGEDPRRHDLKYFGQVTVDF